jgi:hypothetical protein
LIRSPVVPTVGGVVAGLGADAVRDTDRLSMVRAINIAASKMVVWVCRRALIGLRERYLSPLGHVPLRALRRSFISRTRCMGSVGLASSRREDVPLPDLMAVINAARTRS